MQSELLDLATLSERTGIALPSFGIAWTTNWPPQKHGFCPKTSLAGLERLTS